MRRGYYIQTTKEAQIIVDSKDYRKIDEYTTTDEKIYHIAIHAVETENLDVLNHISNRIKIEYVPDTNSYTLLYLAVENIIEKNISVDFIDKLCEIATKNGQEHDLSYPSIQLITINDPRKYDLIDYFIAKGIDLWYLYHFSIVWNHPEIIQYLLDRHWTDKLKVEQWTSQAYQIAECFQSTKSLTFLNKCSHFKSYKFRSIN